MRIIICAFVCLICNAKSQAQDFINIDSLTQKMCNTFKTEKFESDSMTVANMFNKHMVTYLQQLTQQEIDSLFIKCFFRLQFSCNEFKIVLEKNDINKGD